MSTFEVKVRQIDKVEAHPNADRLDIVKIGGYTSVAQKGIHKDGDLIVYIPEDTVFTDLSIAERLNVHALLTGKQKNRVKAIRLRGVFSQGICLPRSAFDGLFPIDADEFTPPGTFWNPITDLGDGEWAVTGSDDIISILKLEKYEEPIPIQMQGKVRKWPSFLPHFDIENIKRPESIAALVPGEEVIVTEKLHGTNTAVAIGPGLEEGEEAYVCSRGYALQEEDTNVYWRATRKFDLIPRLRMYMEDLIHTGLWPSINNVSLHGEVIGVQDLKYGFVNGDIGFYAFAIRVNDEFLSWPTFKLICQRYNIPMVPVIFHGRYDYQTIYDLVQNHATSLVDGKTMCEGGVLVPLEERRDPVAGRVAFKFVREEYILRKGGTELR